MDKLAVFAVVAVLLALVQQGLADIFFQRQPLNQKEMDEFPHIDFKCIPGRTTIKFEAPKEVIAPKDSDELDARRYHMNWKNFGEKDESCKMCVCSAEGKDEYCVRRPAINTNECLEMNGFTKEFNMNIPFNHDRDLSQRMRRAGATVNGACVPYVSEYTDCSKENQCTGCTRCTCSPEATWVCKTVRECPRESEPIDEGSVDDAFNSLLHEFKSKDNDERRPEQISSAKPEKKVLVPDKKDDPYIEGEIMSLLRDKRSPTDKDLKDDKTNNDTRHYSNGTITFYHTVDELNEDTLKNSNSSGTVEVPKVDNEKSLRRTEFLVKDNNITFENDLQIEPNKLQHYDQIIDNKIDSNQTGSDLLDQEKFGIKNNQTQKQKDKDLSKIVVNELKVGSEYIGDKNAPVRSNITFTPDNDTLTAMAFIAGNLLNKLWDMEKETSDEALELEAIKNEKLQDLLELFKEPLTIRQEKFLKTALESLSKSIDKHRNTKNVNISICESINEAKKFVEDAENMSWERSKLTMTDDALLPQNETNKPLNLNKDATAKAVSKLNNVLGLMKKYELVQKQLHKIKNTKTGKVDNEFYGKTVRSGDDLEKVAEIGNSSLNLFGNILKKITKLLLPYKTNKKIVHKIKNTNMLVNSDNLIKKRIKDTFNTDVGNATLSIKDRIILDYLIKIKKNPKSLLEDDSEEGSSHAEKDIMLNLSEFFKMKSLVDLVKMLDIDVNLNGYKNRLKDITTSKPITTTEVITTKKYTEIVFSSTKQLKTSTTDSSAQFASTKDKLKAHLRNILDDLVELNKESGRPGKYLDIASALPCIYNMLKSGDIFNTSVTTDPYTKLSKMFEDLKKEYQVVSTSLNRRMNKKEIINIARRIPKSALVWERVVKNVEKQQKQSARRNLDIRAPIPVQDLLKKLEQVEALSSLNKFNLKKTLDPTDRLMILKAFHAENQRNLDSLKDVKASLDSIVSLPKELQNDITDFVYKTAKKASFHKKVLQYIDQNKKIMNVQSNNTLKLISNSEAANNVSKVELPSSKTKAIQKGNNEEANKKEKKIVLSRDLVLNQLIKNRVSAYLKSMEGKIDFRNDPNYNIAKGILLNLENGNSQLAKQLYKIFITSKKQTSKNNVNEKKLSNKIFQDESINEKQLNRESILSDTTAPAPFLPIVSDILANAKQQTILDKEPIVQFQDTRRYAHSDILSARREQILHNLLAAPRLSY